MESASGSIGSTAPGTYTLVARRRASRSSAESSATYADTSAMWTQTRTLASSSRSAEIASSKSRAVTGSIVNVTRSRRSRRGAVAAGPGGSRPASRASRASRLHERVERPPQPAVEHQPLDHVARDVGAAEHAHDAGMAGRRPAPAARP